MSHDQSIDLSQFDDDYTQAELPERGNFDPVPDGKYQVIVDRVEIKQSQEGKYYLNWQLKILNGPSANSRLFRNNMLATPENMKWLKGDLHVCGLDDVMPSTLQANLNRLLDIVLEVTARTKGTDNQGRPNQNVYLNRRLTGVDVGEPGPGTGYIPPEEAAPF